MVQSRCVPVDADRQRCSRQPLQPAQRSPHRLSQADLVLRLSVLQWQGRFRSDRHLRDAGNAGRSAPQPSGPNTHWRQGERRDRCHGPSASLLASAIGELRLGIPGGVRLRLRPRVPGHRDLRKSLGAVAPRRRLGDSDVDQLRFGRGCDLLHEQRPALRHRADRDGRGDPVVETAHLRRSRDHGRADRRVFRSGIISWAAQC